MVNYYQNSSIFPPDSDLNPFSYIKSANKIKNNDLSLIKKKIAIISSSTADVIESFLIVELAKRGIKGVLKFLPFNQFEQEIFNDNSTLYNFKPDMIVLLPLVEDTCADNIGKISEKLIKNFLKRFESWVKKIRSKSKANIISSNFEISNYYPKNISDSLDLNSIDFSISKANVKMAEICNNVSDCFLLDYKKTILSLGLTDWMDRKLFFLGKVSQSHKAQIFLSRMLSRYISAILFGSKKCIVLDADNTLWGGVIGEDGLEGILLSDSYPGNIFKEFHQYLLRLRSKGVILALASKNNYQDILSVFKNHKDCILKLEHFTAVKINWDDKATNIQKIASEINLGLDSFVFIDDNPVEREWAKKKIPELLVPELPKEPIKFIECIENLEAFDFLRISNEDKMRAKMYKNEQKRKKDKLKSTTLEGFLKGLRMKAFIENINNFNLKRVVQLINKTNQFNLTVRRHNESEIKQMIKDGAIGLTLRLSDKYGDSGLVGLSIVKPNKKADIWEIDSFLLSCRVLGRNVEDFLLSMIVEEIKKKCQSASIKLVGEYIEEKKNSQVADFFPERGFRKFNDYKNRWFKDVSKDPIPKPEFIKLV